MINKYFHSAKTTFLKRTITGDKKWIVYNNVEQKIFGENEKPPLIPKADLHPKKV